MNVLGAAGIDCERATRLYRDKVDEALDVTELTESDLYKLGTRKSGSNRADFATTLFIDGSLSRSLELSPLFR